MPDCAAAPIQPLVEGFVTFPGGVGTAPVFDGKGISLILRGASAQGSYIMQFDVGLPGTAGAVEAIPELPLLLPIDPNVRTMVTPLGVGVPPVSGVSSIGVSYIASFNPLVGAIFVEVVLTNLLFVPVDPQNGFQIIVWRGLGGGPVL